MEIREAELARLDQEKSDWIRQNESSQAPSTGQIMQEAMDRAEQAASLHTPPDTGVRNIRTFTEQFYWL